MGLVGELFADKSLNATYCLEFSQQASSVLWSHNQNLSASSMFILTKDS